MNQIKLQSGYPFSQQPADLMPYLKIRTKEQFS